MFLFSGPNFAPSPFAVQARMVEYFRTAATIQNPPEQVLARPEHNQLLLPAGPQQNMPDFRSMTVSTLSA
jgi:hypothetical protein